MGQEKLLDIIRRTKYFEKPCKQRTRYSYERCKAIYDEDMSRKIAFVMRKNRADPFVGQYWKCLFAQVESQMSQNLLIHR